MTAFAGMWNVCLAARLGSGHRITSAGAQTLTVLYLLFTCRYAGPLEAAHGDEKLLMFEQLLEAAVDLDR